MAADWWELVPAVVGALAGAAAATIPAYFLARMASKETLARDQASRREEKKAAVFRGFVKLGMIANGIGSIRRHINEQIAEADARGQANMSLWQKVIPAAGLSATEIRFDADDLTVFIEAGEFDYVTKLLGLAERRVALESALRDYADMRKLVTNELASLAPAPTAGNGYGLNLSDIQRAKFEPRFLELESLVTQMRDFAAKGYAAAQKLTAQFGPKARAALPGSDFPDLTSTSPQS